MKDLFDYLDELPKDVINILDKYNAEEQTYDSCANLVADLESVGYTCEYGLDGIPYGLNKL